MDKKTFDIENCRLNAERQRKVSERQLEIGKIRLDYDGRIVAIEHERLNEIERLRAIRTKAIIARQAVEKGTPEAEELDEAIHETKANMENERERMQREIRALNLEMMHNIEFVRQAGREYECEWLLKKNELKLKLEE